MDKDKNTADRDFSSAVFFSLDFEPVGDLCLKNGIKTEKTSRALEIDAFFKGGSLLIIKLHKLVTGDGVADLYHEFVDVKDML